MKNSATLQMPDGKTAELPIVTATMGENALDVSALYKNTGYFTYDPGFLSTASCKSSITFIDGDAGILLHRGHTIASLCEKSDFVSVFYALLFGELPQTEEKSAFESKLISKMILEEDVKGVIKGFSKESHPMAIMMAALSVLSAKNGGAYNAYKPETLDETGIDLVAKTAMIGAYVFRFTSGLSEGKFKLDSNLPFMENFAEFMFEGTAALQHKKTLISALEKIFILHADHEQNASTSTVRLVASTDANIYASAVAGFAALWGPLHGGANEAVLNMLGEIKEVKNIPMFIERAKDKNDPFKLMGFGHRVYKNYDPRAAVLKSSCDEILEKMDADNEGEALKIAKELEKIALNDSYFKDRKLFPNVDFYSGIIYKALGMKSSFFTVVFGMARSAGWAAQIKEAMMDDAKRISRPRQVYTGKIG